MAMRTLELSNFPASWVKGATEDAAEANLAKKTRSLLEKFGTLEQSPTITRRGDGSRVVLGVFKELGVAEKAVQTLNQLDNRTEKEKVRAGNAPPQEHEKFCVKVLTDAPQPAGPPAADPPPAPALPAPPDAAAPAAAPGAAARPAATAIVESCHVRVSRVPAEWTEQDVEELCTQYGSVDEAKKDAPGSFTITFHAAARAAAAAQSLDGLQVQGERGPNYIACQLLPPEAVAATNAGGAYDPEATDEPQGEGLALYVDEVRLSTGEPSRSDREIFLRDLPLEDYTEPQLREWLASFGATEEIYFLTDPETKQLTGRGYVRFKTHEEAAGLIEAFPKDDEEGNVQGTWSLSERLVQIRGAREIRRRLKALAVEANCASLALVGDGQATPMRFVAKPQERLKRERKALEAKLCALLDDVVAGAARQPTLPVKTAAPSGAAATPEVAPAPPAAPAAEEIEATPTQPCVIVRGFPASWKEQQVKLVFAIFGGVNSVRFCRGLDSGGRVAHVELKNPENMVKAVEQLHESQVGDGDLIEKCSLRCELFQGESVRQAGPARRALYVDELPMLKRPELAPGSNDREVFLTSLPVKECDEVAIKGWLEGFGTVESVTLLRDFRTGELTGQGYCRFKTHMEANACVEAQAEGADQDEGDVVARWSESERALQRANSAYGIDVCTAFVGPSGRVLASILVSSKTKEVWMLSEQHQPKDKGAPKPEGQQLHFCTLCDDDQFAELRRVLTNVLQTFHEKAGKRLQDAKAKEANKRRPSAASPPGTAGPQQPWQRPPAPEHWQSGNYGPAAGYDWSRGPPPQAADGPYARPPPPHGWYPQGAPPGAGPPGGAPPGGAPPGSLPGGPGGPPPRGYPPPQDGRYFPAPAGGHSPPPDAWLGPPRPGAGAPGAAGAHAAPPARPQHPPQAALPQAPVPSPLPQPGDGQRNGDREALRPEEGRIGGPEVQTLIKKGEKSLKQGKTADNRNNKKEAWEKYSKGLNTLMEAIRALPTEEGGEVGVLRNRLRKRVASCLEEAERVKEEMGAQQAEMDEDQAEDDEEVTENPPPKPKPVVLRSNSPKSPLGQMERGEALVREGQQLERDPKRREEAYERYCAGLQLLLEVMKTNEGDPEMVGFKEKINGYLEQAERLKEGLEATPDDRDDRQREEELPSPPGTEGGEVAPGHGHARRRRRNEGGHRHKNRRENREAPQEEAPKSRSRSRQRGRRRRGGREGGVEEHPDAPPGSFGPGPLPPLPGGGPPGTFVGPVPKGPPPPGWNQPSLPAPPSSRHSARDTAVPATRVKGGPPPRPALGPPGELGAGPMTGAPGAPHSWTSKSAPAAPPSHRR